jgi:hypothetical protein
MWSASTAAAAQRHVNVGYNALACREKSALQPHRRRNDCAAKAYREICRRRYHFLG